MAGEQGEHSQELPWHRDIPGQDCHAQRENRGTKGLGHCLAISLLGMNVLNHLLGFFSVLFLNFVQPTSFFASAVSVLFFIPAE